MEFLLASRPRFNHEPPLAEAALSESPDSTPQPLLVLGDFVAEVIPRASVQAAPIRVSQPVLLPLHAVLPGGVSLASLGLCVSSAAGLACSTKVSHPPPAAHTARPAGFVCERPRIAAAVNRPLWLEPARQAPAQRPRAAFVPLRPTWRRIESESARAIAVARFQITPALPEPALALSSPALRLSGGSRPSIGMGSRPAPALERNGTTWVRPGAVLCQPSPSVTLHPSGFRGSGLMAAPAPPAVPAPASAPLSTACRSAVAQGPALTPSLSFVRHPRPFVPAPHASMIPPLPIAAKAPKPVAPATFIWKSQVRLGSVARVSPSRPQFEATEEDVPACHFEPVLTTPPRKRLVRLWGSAPPWTRHVVVLLLLAAILWVGVSRLSTSASTRAAQSALWARINRRAAIELQDDFRSGLSQWSGAPNWANTWSYDGTGFARPGHLALLSSSLPMSDYRLEFLAQIETGALGWVFRASDVHNYYATKLVELKRGPTPVFFITHYAVISGRERFKVQLPLPVTASARTMIRVRQEVRGAQFTTYLDGQILDTWSDRTFTRGGVGFFTDPGEAAYIRWIEVAQNDNALGRFCSYLVSANNR